MWSKKMALVGLLIFLTTNLFAQDIKKLDEKGLPSKEFTFYLMDNQPELVWQMVRKLYALEQAPVSISIPELLIIEKTDSSLVLGYAENSVGSIGLGMDIYKVYYEFKLENKVKIGYKPEYKIPIVTYLAVGGALLLTGFVAGLSLR